MVGTWWPPPLPSPSSVSVAHTPSAPSSIHCSGNSRRRAARCRWCFRWRDFCISLWEFSAAPGRPLGRAAALQVGMLMVGSAFARRHGAHLDAGVRGLRTRDGTRRGILLCTCSRRGAALVRQAPRICVRLGGKRDRRRHLGHAAAGGAGDALGWRDAYGLSAFSPRWQAWGWRC